MHMFTTQNSIRLIIMLMFTCISQTMNAQDPLDRKISVQFEELSLNEALIEISRIADIPVSFKGTSTLSMNTISIDESEISINDLLIKVLQPYFLTHKYERGQIFISKRKLRKYTVSGYVRDSISGESLPHANIYLPGTSRGTVTNAFGYFSFQIPEGRNTVIISFLGYGSKELNLDVNSNLTRNINLNPSLNLPPVVIIADPRDIRKPTLPKLPEDNLLAKRRLLGQLDFVGISDFFRELQWEPGVTSGADGAGGLHVRGGSLDQNLVTLDGVTVYNPYHYLGLFSIFDENLYKSGKIFKSGIPASYGGRLSSVIDLQTRDGNMSKHTATISTGLFLSSIQVEGPIDTAMTSYFVSARRTHVDPFIEDISRRVKENNGDVGFIDYKFHDINAKISTQLNERNRVFFTFYNGNDKYHNETVSEFVRNNDRITEEVFQDLDWGNTIAAISSNHLLGKDAQNIWSNSVSFSDFRFANADTLTFFQQSEFFRITELLFTGFNSQITDFSYKTSFDFNFGENQTLSTGLEFINHQFRPGIVGVNSDVIVDFDTEFLEILASLEQSDSIKANEGALYVQYSNRLTDNLLLNLGLRPSIFNVEGKTYINVSPRLSFYSFLSKTFHVGASIDRSVQYLHLLSSTDAGLPNDLWVPSTNLIPPETSWQFNLEARKSQGPYSMKLEGYYKKFDNLLAYQEGSILDLLLGDLIDASQWEEIVAVGEGRSYGTEFALSKSRGKTLFNLAYTLSWTDRQFDEINEGEPFRYRYDSRHRVDASVQHHFNDYWSINAQWTYGSGNTLSLPRNEFAFVTESGTIISVFNFGEKNSYTLPANHRLDVNVNYTWEKGKTNQGISFGVYNLYNRQNPFYIYLKRQKENPVQAELRQVSLVPILPSFRYFIKI